jgi:hypothetical protein
MAAAEKLNRVYVALLGLFGVLITQQWIGALFDSYRVAAGFYDAFHGVWYALLTWLVLLVLQQRFAAFNVWLWIGGIWCAMLGLAVLGELGKALVDQPLGVRDVVLSMLGVTAVLVLWGAERGVFPVRASIALALVLLAASTLPVWQARALQHYRDGMLPDLVRFDDPRAHQLILSNSEIAFVTAPDEWRTHAGHRVLGVRFADTEFPSVIFPEPVPDWHRYSALVIDVYQPDDRRRPLYLRLLVRQRNGAETYLIDRPFELAYGEHRLELPLDAYRGDGTPRVADIELRTNEDYRDRRLLIGALRLQ